VKSTNLTVRFSFLCGW